MRVLLVGAGAVGVVLARALEQTKGTELTFFLRPGKKLGFVRTKILDSRTGQLHVRERPTCVELGQKRPVFDTVLFCVRAEQLLPAIADVGELDPRVRVATITPGPDGLALLRAKYPGHPSARIGPAFMAYPEGDTITVWHPPLLKTPVCHEEGGAESAAFAAELASMLELGGVPARARDRMIPGVDSATDAMAPLLAVYGLAGYDACVLAGDPALLGLAGDAIAEVLALAGVPGIASAIARRATAPLVRAALNQAVPRLPAGIRSMWRTHAPKIDAQTRDALRDLGARARAQGHSADALGELARRMDQRPTSTPPA